MHERQEKQMKNEFEKFAVGAGTACTVVLSELFFTTGIAEVIFSLSFLKASVTNTTSLSSAFKVIK